MPAGRDRYSHNKDKDLEPFLEQLWIDLFNIMYFLQKDDIMWMDGTLQFENENKCCKSPKTG